MQKPDVSHTWTDFKVSDSESEPHCSYKGFHMASELVKLGVLMKSYKAKSVSPPQGSQNRGSASVSHDAQYTSPTKGVLADQPRRSSTTGIGCRNHKHVLASLAT